MLRKGSPWTGMWTVVGKEMADHFSSVRIRILEVLIVVTAAGAVYAAIGSLRDTVGQDPFLLLRIFTTAKEPLISFMAFLGFLVPIVAIALGFDAVNSEHSNRTMSRVLSQPIYRDALLLGKFLAGLFTLGLVLLALWLLIIGLALFFLGIPPSGEEVIRAFAFLAATIVYGGVWLALAMMFSTIFRQPATAALTRSGGLAAVRRVLADADRRRRRRPEFRWERCRRCRRRPGTHAARPVAAIAEHPCTARSPWPCSTRRPRPSGRCSSASCRGRSLGRRCRSARACFWSGRWSPGWCRR